MKLFQSFIQFLYFFLVSFVHIWFDIRFFFALSRDFLFFSYFLQPLIIGFFFLFNFCFSSFYFCSVFTPMSVFTIYVKPRSHINHLQLKTVNENKFKNSCMTRRIKELQIYPDLYWYLQCELGELMEMRFTLWKIRGSYIQIIIIVLVFSI